jgi:hypothetical protein
MTSDELRKHADSINDQSSELLLREAADDLEILIGAMSAQDERESQAGVKCGVPYENHGCDWPNGVADEVLRLRRRVEELEGVQSDDGDAITENWLRSIGFDGHMRKNGPGMWRGDLRVTCDGQWILHPNRMVTFRNRGELRRLREALEASCK